MEVVPTFYTDEGEQIIGPTILLQPAEIRFVSVESLIPAEYRRRHNWGGMSLSYVGKLMEVWAQITVRGSGQRGSADETFSVLNGLGSDTQEAVYWQPKPGRAIFALGNSSSVAIHTTVEFSDASSQEFDIAPHATRYVRRNFANSGGSTSHSGSGQAIKLVTIGPPGSLKATGYVISNSNNFASTVRFYDTLGVVQAKLFATDFRLKHSASHLLLKNTTSTTVTARPSFRPTEGNGDPVELPHVILGAGEIVELDLRNLLAAADTRQDLDSVSVQIDNDGAAGSLIGALYCRNTLTNVNYDIPLRDSGRIRNSTGTYPWRLDGDYKTTVSITNVSSMPSQFRVTIFYSDGSYFVKPPELLPGQTKVFDLRRIRDEHIPDERGNVIPENVTSGQFTWSIIRAIESSRPIGRREVVSESENVSSSYSCNLCCSDSGPMYDVPFIGLFAGQSSNFTVNEGWQSCTGWTSWYAGSLPSLYTYSPQTATADMVSYGLMGANGISAGDTLWSTENYTYWQYYEGPYDCYLDMYPTYTEGPIEVRPIVTNVTATGATKITQITGNQNIIHFVTPKSAANSQVTLAASLSQSNQQILSDISWEGATESANNPLEGYA